MLHLFQINILKNMSFKLYKAKSNLFSCFILSLIAIISYIAIIISIHKPIEITTVYTMKSTYILLTWTTMWLIAYLIFIKFGNRDSSLLTNILVFAYIFPIFYINTFVYILNAELVSNIARYVIFIFPHCLFFLLSIPESIALFMPMAIINIIHLFLKLPNDAMLYNLVFNLIAINATSLIYSIIKITSSIKKFKTHKLLLDTISERDEAYNKLRAHETYVTDFFVNISHDIKTPLNIIYSSEQLLEKQISNKSMDFPKAEKYITSIKLNSFRLNRLLNNVLDISKIDASRYTLNLRNLDLVTTMEGLIDSLSDYMSSKGIDIIFDTEFEEKILALDEEKLERIILNLLSNSLKFTPTGGKILILLSESSDQVFVSIKDSGIGIDENTQQTIFDRFVQAKATPINNIDGSGSGIGLSLVKSLMVLHGGDVTLKSKLGEGSNFTLIFPKKVIETTLQQDISSGSIYPNSDISASAHLEFAGLIKKNTNTNIST